MKLQVTLRGLVLIGLFSAVAFGLKLAGVLDVLDETWVDRYVRGRGLLGEALFVALAATVMAAGLPRQAICFLAGYAFDFTYGTVLALVASTIACMGTFYYARLLGRGLVQSRLSARVRKLDAFLHDHPLAMTLLVRSVPVGSNLFTNLAAGVSSIRAPWFFLGSAIGYIPQTVIFALAGSGINIDPGLRIGTAMILFALSAAIGATLYHRYRHGLTAGEDIDAALGETDAVPVSVKLDS